MNHIATEYGVPLPDSACVYCGNCIAVCPTGALMFKTEYDASSGRVGRVPPDPHRYHLSLLRRGMRIGTQLLTRFARHIPQQDLVVYGLGGMGIAY